MKKRCQLLLLAIVTLLINAPQANAQYVTKKVKTKHQIYTDSLKSVEYNYIFPILGKGAYSRGFDIPYPMGLMANYMWIDQGLAIDNLQLGLKTDNRDIPLTPVEFIQFGENKNTSYSLNVRPDLWVFPFLDVYGIFGVGQSRTEVNLVAPISLKSVVEQQIKTTGFGLLTAFGVGPVWVSVDANWTWNKPELLDQAVRVNVMGLRVGHTFTFKNHPERNIAVWAGAMRVKMNTESSGQVTMKDALPPEVWEKTQEFSDNYWAWYNSLDPNKPLDAKKIEKADEILTPIVESIENADGNSIIRYGMDKQVAELWNGIVGIQFQLNKNWMLRSEGGIIGDRKSFLLSLNYRFLGI